LVHALKAFSFAFGLIYAAEYPMDEHESFSNSIYEEQTYLAERELSSFIAGVTELYGPEQARLSEKDWLDGVDGQSAVVNEPTVASSHNRSLSSTGRPIEHHSA
jgi:hypothetical protein